MSRALAIAERKSMDAYLTDDQVALASTGLLPLAGWRVLEGSAGEGAFVRAAWTAHGVVPDVVEVRRECETHLSRFTDRPQLPVLSKPGRPACTLEDYGMEWRGIGRAPVAKIGRFERFDRRGYDCVVGNPPYRHAEKHVRHALYLVRPGGIVAFLLRLNFLASDKRYAFRNDFPVWRIYVLQERPSFTGEGADACEYGLFVWRRGWTSGDTITRYFSWKYPTRYLSDRARIIERDWPLLRGLDGD